MATASFSSTINLNNGTITLTDTSDFVSQGVALINVNGNFKVTSPSGNVLYDNGLNYYFETDTAQSGSTTSMQLADDATSIPLAGYYLLATGGAGSGQVARVATYNTSTKLATFVSPVAVAFDNTTTYRLCLATNFLAANLSNQPTISLYSGSVIEQGTYTIDYTVYNSNSGEYYVSQSTVDYTYTLPTVVIQQTADCLSPLLTSVDATDYTLYGGIQPDNLTRTHTIIYPPSTGVADVVGNTANMYTSILYNNGTYTTTISTVVSWTLPDGTVVSATLTGEQEKLIQCEQWICDVYCCLKSVYNEWQQYINTNMTLAEQYRQRWINAIGLSAMIQASYSCGDSDAVAGYVNTLRTITNCNSGCQCDDGTISLIQGLGNITNTYALQTGTPNWLYRTQTVSGSTTSWEIGLTSTAITALTQGNVVTPDTNTKVTVTGSGSTASYAVKGAVVTTGVGVESTFSGGTVNPVYTLDLQNLLLSDYVPVASTTSGSWETLGTYTLQQDIVTAEGDTLVITGLFNCTGNGKAKKVRIQVASTTVFAEIPADLPQITQLFFTIKLVRITNTSVAYYFSYKGGNTLAPTIREIAFVEVNSLFTVNDLDAATNTIEFEGYSIDIGDITLSGSSVEIQKI